MIRCCLENRPLPIYGKGENIRDWLYVEDHIEAIWTIIQKGRINEVYDIGGSSEITNNDMVCLLIELISSHLGVDPKQYHSLINYVPDRAGHDYRYAIDSHKLTSELGWSPQHLLDDGLRKTVGWYLSRWAHETVNK